MDTFLLCVMFASFSELRSVLQGLIQELILSHTVNVRMGPICNGCRVWSSLSVAAHFTHNIVNNTRNSHLWDHDNPHGTVESNYQHRFPVNVWCGVIGDQLIGPYIFLQHLTGDIYATFLQDELPALSRECTSTNIMTDVLPAQRSTTSFQSFHHAVSES